MSAPCYYGCFDVLTQRSDTSVRKRSSRWSVVCFFPKVMLWSSPCAEFVIFACHKRLVWLRPFLESGPQPDQLCCMLFINTWPRRPGHNSVHEQVCSTHWRQRVFNVGAALEPQLDSTYSVHYSQATARLSALDNLVCLWEHVFVFSTNQLPARATARFIQQLAPI